MIALRKSSHFMSTLSNWVIIVGITLCILAVILSIWFLVVSYILLVSGLCLGIIGASIRRIKVLGRGINKWSRSDR